MFPYSIDAFYKKTPAHPNRTSGSFEYSRRLVAGLFAGSWSRLIAGFVKLTSCETRSSTPAGFRILSLERR